MSAESERRLLRSAERRGDLALINVLREYGALRWDDADEQPGITITVQFDVFQDAGST